MIILDETVGRKVGLGNVPAVVTDNHNEVFYYWQIAGIKKASLFHVDGHSDMGGGVELTPKASNIPLRYYQKLMIDNFIVPAYFYGIIDSIWWLNPHSEEKKLQFMGCKDKKSKRKLGVNVLEIVPGYFTMDFVSESGSFLFDEDHYYQGVVKALSEINIGANKPWILDIDLDAFCCDRDVNNVPRNYNGILNYEKRIDETLKVLMRLKKPDLVTITLSNGNNAKIYSYPFVPQNLSAKVKDYLLEGLRDLYW